MAQLGTVVRKRYNASMHFKFNKNLSERFRMLSVLLVLVTPTCSMRESKFVPCLRIIFLIKVNKYKQYNNKYGYNRKRAL